MEERYESRIHPQCIDCLSSVPFLLGLIAWITGRDESVVKLDPQYPLLLTRMGADIDGAGNLL